MVVHENYPLGDPNAEQKTFVTVYKPNSFSSGVPLAKRDSTPSTSPIIGTRVDLTPSECTSQACYPGEHQFLIVGPQPPGLNLRVFLLARVLPSTRYVTFQKDCQVIVAAQLYNSTGSLTAAPVILTFLVALYDELYGQYNWASLGKVMLGLIKKCKMSQGISIGLFEV
ncbi:hypothetical protein VP01_2010g5 [Puccinia sorghi]|uniref:Uncharacterized protein n=1 Tax=Puccinia sorghi TaxID=27349 RepID=A0A0L6VBA7_9BASI|nr:hypothetical protein VP01_2010g5 [Puccinia sorghi]